MESWRPSRPVPRLPPQTSLFSALPRSMRNPGSPSVQVTSSIISYQQHPVRTSLRCEQLYPERDRSEQLIRNTASRIGRRRRTTTGNSVVERRLVPFGQALAVFCCCFGFPFQTSGLTDQNNNISVKMKPHMSQYSTHRVHIPYAFNAACLIVI
jgi:hypothetical protein